MSGFDLDALLTRDPEHPTELDLDEWVAGVLTTERAAEIDTHCAGCEMCAAYVAEVRQGPVAIPGLDPDRAFDAIWARASEPEPEPEAAPVEPQPSGFMTWLKRLLSPGGLALVAVGAAAVAFFVLRSGPPDPGPVDPGIRLKGDFALELARKTTAGAQAMASGDAFAADDEIRFVVTLPTDGVVRVVGVEADGTLYTAWPLPQHGADPRMKAGEAQQLAGAVRLDGRAGRETMHLVLCPAATEPACTSAGSDAAPTCPAGCRTTPFVIVKQPR